MYRLGSTAKASSKGVKNSWNLTFDMSGGTKARSGLRNVRSMEGLEASFEGGTDKLQLMNARVDHLLDEALALKPDDRSALVVALLDSLDGEDEATVTKAWADEIRRRKDERRSGAASAVPWAEARARLTAL